MSARRRVRSVARRLIGVPDASEVDETLANLRAALDELDLAVTTLRKERSALDAEVTRLRDELLQLERAVLEQVAVLEDLQSQRSRALDR